MTATWASRTYPQRTLSVALAVLLLAALIPFQAVTAFGITEGATWYVNAATGDDLNPGTSAEPFASIPAAVAAAGDGDTILVSPGTYFQLDSTIEIGGFSDLTIASTGGASLTTVVGDESGPVFVIWESEDVTIDGFEITGGAYEVGGGVLVEAATATISNCDIRQNFAMYGGGLASLGSTVTVMGCEFSDNWASYGGAGMGAEYSVVSVKDSEFVANGEFFYEPGWFTEFGGGMEIYYSQATISGTTFDGNLAGGGAGVMAWGSEVCVSESIATGNETTDSESIPLTLANKYPLADREGYTPRDSYEASGQVVGPLQIDYEPQYGAGGGLALYDGAYSVSASQFLDNIAGWEGGGVYTGAFATLSVADSLFEGNSAEFGAGVRYNDQDIFFPVSASILGSWEDVQVAQTTSDVSALRMPEKVLTVDRSVFRNNNSMGAPALYFDSASGMASVTNSLFTANTSAWVGTVAMFSELGFETNSTVLPSIDIEPGEPPAAITMANCTFAGNTVGNSTALYGYGPWDVRNTILWGNLDSGEDRVGFGLADAMIEGGASFTYCDLQYGYVPDGALIGAPELLPVYDGVGNFSEDPLFGPGYRLSSGSPCVDTGTSEGAPFDDLVGMRRPMDGDGDGLRAWDIGAYEYFDTVARLVGVSRYATAVQASQQHFDSAQTVVIATGQVFADGLSAAGLAGSYGSPILLSPTSTMPALVKAEIVRLGATNAVIVGGKNAISAAVMDDLISMGLTVERIGGADRYETAALVAQAIADREGEGFSGVGFVARGDTFPDALSVSPIAYAMKSPILLVKPGSLPKATLDVIEAMDFDEFMIAGGSGAVGSMALGALEADVVQVGGIDRYDTSAKISDYAVEKGWAQMTFTGIATGENFPDALTGGAALGVENGVLLLTPYKALHSSAKFLVEKRADEVQRVEVLGGTNAISETVWDSLSAILN